MPISETPLLERVARVLAGAAHSDNALGSNPSAATAVDRDWQRHVVQATMVLNTMREPDEAMVAVGDLDTWSRMIDVAVKHTHVG